MLGQGKGSGTGGCCSPPPLLYIPAAAQRVTHLHGPPKLERIHGTEGLSSVSDSPPLLTRHGQCSADSSSDNKLSTSCSTSLTDSGKSSVCLGTRPSSAVDFTTRYTKDRSPALSNDVRKDDKKQPSPYARNTKSCPLYVSSDISRIEKAKRDLSSNITNSYSSGLPVSSPLTQAVNTDIIQVGHNVRSHDMCTPGEKQNDKSAILDIDSPDSAISLGTNSLLENLQRAHDKISGLMSTSETSSKETKLSSSMSVINGGHLAETSRQSTSFTQVDSSGVGQLSGSPDQTHLSSFSRKHGKNHQERGYLQSSAVSEPPIAEQSGDISPFQPAARHAFSPPWSHLHAMYHQNASPPKPYTLSLTKSLNPDPVVPRTIPIIPTSKVPVLSSSKHISIPFSEGFVRKACMNQTYPLPKAFAGLGKDEKASNEDVKRTLTIDSEICRSNGKDNSFDISNTPRDLESRTFDSPSSNCDRSFSIINKVNRDFHIENSPSTKSKKLANQKTPDRDISKNPKESTSTTSESPLSSEVKKRRGRPPGSKNKKTLALLEKGKQENQPNCTTQTNNSNDSKESDGCATKSTKKKKVECPILRPTDEEFKDPMGYLKSVRTTLEKFGICIIDPPESWKVRPVCLAMKVFLFLLIFSDVENLTLWRSMFLAKTLHTSKYMFT